MPSKRTATRPAATQPRAITAARRAAVPLAPIQVFIADAVADLITSGAAERALDEILKLSLRHRWNGFADNKKGAPQLSTPAKSAETVKELAATTFPISKAELQIAISERRRQENPEASEARAARSVTELIRQNVIGNLRGAFQDFMGVATPEECRLLLRVFEHHGSSSIGATDFDQNVLAESFMRAIDGECINFVRVPADLREKVDEYVAALTAEAA